MHELVTHTSGYAEFGAATLRSAAWKAPLGQNFFTADSTQMTEETRDQTLSGRGRYAYSTLGSAIAGQAVAAAAHMSYPDLMRTRLFEPLGMSHTAIEVERPARRRRKVADRPPGPAMGHGRVRPRRCRGLHHRRPREARHRAPRRDRTRHGRPGAHHRHRPVEHPHRWLLGHLHLADRPDHHPARRADRRLRLLPRPRPRPTQGRHRPVRRRQRRQRPRAPSSSPTASSTATDQIPTATTWTARPRLLTLHRSPT